MAIILYLILLPPYHLLTFKTLERACSLQKYFLTGVGCVEQRLFCGSCAGDSFFLIFNRIIGSWQYWQRGFKKVFRLLPWTILLLKSIFMVLIKTNAWNQLILHFLITFSIESNHKGERREGQKTPNLDFVIHGWSLINAK